MLDLIGSVVLSSVVILLGLQLSFTISGSAQASTANVNIQESLVDIVRTYEYDLHNVDTSGAAITPIAPGHLRIRRNLGGIGVIDSVDWYVGPTGTFADNPSARTLFRQENRGTPQGFAQRVTMFTLGYSSLGGRIAMVETTLKVVSPYTVQNQVNPDDTTKSYAEACWHECRRVVRNITR
jgi:hypothetical protein